MRAWYDPHLERLHDGAPARRADLGELEAIAAGFAGRERFLTEITLDPPAAAGEQAGVPLRDEDYLILSTIHSAKGQEWRRVYVLNCVDGCIPSDLATGTSAEIDEERRLFYVAMTRARDHADAGAAAAVPRARAAPARRQVRACGADALRAGRDPRPLRARRLAAAGCDAGERAAAAAGRCRWTWRRGCAGCGADPAGIC